MRDEAHRFGITHHRRRREKSIMAPQLMGIEGIGYTLNQKLLWKFKSVKKISTASLHELQETIGKAKGKVVFEHFHK